jgi:hypothetical protein
MLASIRSRHSYHDVTGSFQLAMVIEIVANWEWGFEVMVGQGTVLEDGIAAPVQFITSNPQREAMAPFTTTSKLRRQPHLHTCTMYGAERKYINLEYPLLLFIRFLSLH